MGSTHTQSTAENFEINSNNLLNFGKRKLFFVRFFCFVKYYHLFASLYLFIFGQVCAVPPLLKSSQIGFFSFLVIQFNLLDLVEKAVLFIPTMPLLLLLSTVSNSFFGIHEKVDF